MNHKTINSGDFSLTFKLKREALSWLGKFIEQKAGPSPLILRNLLARQQSTKPFRAPGYRRQDAEETGGYVTGSVRSYVIVGIGAW